MSTDPPANTAAAAGVVCCRCGYCCNGLLHNHVKVSDSERERLAARDSSVGTGEGGSMPLGCAFLRGRLCSIYDERPVKCRDYSCRLRRRVLNGSVAFDDALATLAALDAEIAGLEPVFVAVTGQGVGEGCFHDGSYAVGRALKRRLEAGETITEAERDLIARTFEVVKIIDRELVATGRLPLYGDLMSMIDDGA